MISTKLHSLSLSNFSSTHEMHYSLPPCGRFARLTYQRREGGCRHCNFPMNVQWFYCTPCCRIVWQEEVDPASLEGGCKTSPAPSWLGQEPLRPFRPCCYACLGLGGPGHRVQHQRKTRFHNIAANHQSRGRMINFWFFAIACICG